jgi:hypothetical protein
LRRFGHFHHIERLDALGALRDAHVYSVAAVGESVLGVLRSASTSVARN